MNFCIPYLTIEPIISKLSAQYWYSSVRRGATTENLTILRERLSTIDVSIAAEIGRMDLTMRDVLSLRSGDVIRLKNVQVGDPMVLKVGNRPKFMCKPGLVGNKLSVQIIEKLEDFSKEDFEELAAEGEE